MAAPIIVRPWQFKTNALLLGSPTAGVFPPQYLIASTARNTLWYVKEAFKGSGSWTSLTGAAVSPTGNWAVWYSSDSTVPGTGVAGDGQDHWVAPTNIVSGTGGAVRSWIVLKQPGIASNYQLCIAADAANPYAGTFVASPNAGFTGGTTIARPTAVDEIPVLAAADWGAPATAESSTRIHVMKAADGSATRVIMCRCGYTVALWAFETPSKPIAGWQHPSVTMMVCSSNARQATPIPSLSALNNAAVANGRTLDYPNGLSFASYLTVAAGGASVGLDPVAVPNPNDIDGTTPFYNAEFLNKATFGARGRAGLMEDAWFIPQNYTDGCTVPNDDTRQFVQVGGLAMPWNRSAGSWH